MTGKSLLFHTDDTVKLTENDNNMQVSIDLFYNGVEAKSRMFCIFVRTANHAVSFNSGFKVCFSVRLPEGNCTQVLIKSCGRLF